MRAMQRVALFSGEKSSEQDEKARAEGVSISTIHAAKGLEWASVFVMGIDDKQLPHGMTHAVPVGRKDRPRWFLWLIMLAGANQGGKAAPLCRHDKGKALSHAQLGSTAVWRRRIRA